MFLGRAVRFRSCPLPISPCVLPAKIIKEGRAIDDIDRKTYYYCQESALLKGEIEAIYLAVLELTWYSGASLSKNSCGPMMLPTQYKMKNTALTVAFFVKPPTLELIIVIAIGMAAE